MSKTNAKKFLITGSVAAKHWYPLFHREIGDIDIISEVSVASSKPSDLMVESHWSDLHREIVKINNDDLFVDANMLYTIKMSHAQWDIKWTKTISDVAFFQAHGLQLHPIYHDLVNHWETIHGKKHVNLNVTNEQFFADYVNRKIDHDELHRHVMYFDRPLHELIRDDMNSPKINMDKWVELDESVKFLLFLEELMVIAIERFNLTNKSKNSEILTALSGAYKKLITSMTKGDFCDYMLLNLTKFYRHRQEIADGVRVILNKMYKET